MTGTQGAAPAGAYGQRIALSGLVMMLAWDVGLPLAAKDPESLAELEEGWRESADLRAGFIQLALLWGFGLLIESAGRLVVIYTMSLDFSVAGSTVIQIIAYAVMIWVTIRRIKAMRALAETPAAA